MNINLSATYLSLVNAQFSTALDEDTTTTSPAQNDNRTIQEKIEEHTPNCEASRPENCPYRKQLESQLSESDDVDKATDVAAEAAPYPSEPKMHSARKRASDGMFSKIGKALETASQKISIEGLVPFLKGRGVKDDEISATDLEGFIKNAKRAGASSVTPADVDRWVNSHGYSLEKKTVGFSGTKMNGAKLMKPNEIKQPGGTNYREVLFRDPNLFFEDGQYSHRTGVFSGDPSVVAHARVQDMEVDGGGKCLLVEEAQSDYHEAGSKNGYNKDQNRIDELSRRIESLGDRIWDMESKWKADCENIENSNYTAAQLGQEELLSEDDLVERFTAIYPQELDDMKNEYDSAIDERARLAKPSSGDEVQDAPYKKSWMKYVMKQMFIDAAEKGYDFVAWSGGRTQDDRMGSKHPIRNLKIYKSPKYKNGSVVGSEYQVSFADGRENRLMTLDKRGLEKAFGKDISDSVEAGGKYIQGADQKVVYSDTNHMSAVYDKGGTSSNNIPKIVQQYIRKWGGEVSEVKLANGNTVLGFRIPQSMRSDIMKNGLPSFDELDKETATALVAYLNKAD